MYGAELTNGDGGLLTVGAENAQGTSGQNYYFNGSGTLPTSTTEVRVLGTAATPGATHTITIGARGRVLGNWTNCAEMTAPDIFGTATSCVDGQVVRP